MGDAYLFVDELPAVLALDGALDDRIGGEQLVQVRQAPEREAQGEEGDEGVEERPEASKQE